MTTPTKAQDKSRVWQIIRKIFSNANTGHMKKRVWVSAGAPSGTGPTGIAVGDFVLDTSASPQDVYIYTATDTYTKVAG